MAIKFVYFDVGGVILNFSGGLRDLSYKYSLDYNEVSRVFKKYDGKVCLGEIPAPELWSLYQKELGFVSDEIDFVDYWVNGFSPIPATHKLIKTLESKGTSIGLLTNIFPGVYERSMEKKVIPEAKYTHVVKSCDVHSVKPDQEIYKISQERAGVRGSEILFIDDNKDNLITASELGWNTLLFNENQAVDLTIKILDMLNLN